jgi:predicted RNA-binding protein YlqC (UPF0109 family)
MKELIEFIAKSLVDRPEDVQVQQQEGGKPGSKEEGRISFFLLPSRLPAFL